MHHEFSDSFHLRQQSVLNIRLVIPFMLADFRGFEQLFLKATNDSSFRCSWKQWLCPRPHNLNSQKLFAILVPTAIYLPEEFDIQVRRRISFFHFIAVAVV